MDESLERGGETPSRGLDSKMERRTLGKEEHMERDDNGRSPPTEDNRFVTERRYALRRLTVRRRHERPEPDRRMNERRQSPTRLAFVPFVPSMTLFTSGIMA